MDPEAGESERRMRPSDDRPDSAFDAELHVETSGEVRQTFGEAGLPSAVVVDPQADLIEGLPLL